MMRGKSVIYILLLLLSFSSIGGRSANASNGLCSLPSVVSGGSLEMGQLLRNNAIWGPDRNTDGQQYLVFRRTFDIDNLSNKALINIFADSRYLLWINGNYIMRGPCRFNPARPEYDQCDITRYLQPGKNVIAVLVHYYGNCINGRIMKAQPVLSVAVSDSKTGKVYVKTDNLWKYTGNVCYQSGPRSWNSVIDHIDGRIGGTEWVHQNYDDRLWKNASFTDISHLGTFRLNELPLPRERELTALRLLPSGKSLLNTLPITLKAGEELTVDYGKMTLAYTKVNLTAKANSGLSLHYALRYQKGKTFEEFGGGNYYIAREGKQDFMTTDQWGSHYMVLRCDSGEVTVDGVKVIERVYPYDRIGRFNSSDTLLNDLWKMAVNTIEATSDDANGTDARERNEWIQDDVKASFSCSEVALARPDGSGKTEMRLLKNMIRHAALSQLPDGRIRATFPTDRGPEDCHYFIDDYACQWVGALRLYLNMTGDVAFTKEMYPHLKALLGWFEKQKQSDGLYLLREYTSFDNPFAYITCEGATANAFYYKALKDAAAIAQRLDEDEASHNYKVMSYQLYRSFNRIFWDEQAKAYRSAIWNDTSYAPTVHAQLIALQSGIVPPERMNGARQWLWANYRNKSMKHCCTNDDVKQMVDGKYGLGMPIVYYWLFNELYRTDTADTDEAALNEMRRRWRLMVTEQKDAGTLSESFIDESGQRPSESCHNYGVIPAYYLSSYVLGVRCEKPIELKEIVIEPRLGDLQFAEGTVVTMYGAVKIKWNVSASGNVVNFNFTLPEGVKAVLKLPSNKFHLASSKQVTSTTRGRWTVIRNIANSGSGYYYK
jgi:alpha-L-rhamnosidase